MREGSSFPRRPHDRMAQACHKEAGRGRRREAVDVARVEPHRGGSTADDGLPVREHPGLGGRDRAGRRCRRAYLAATHPVWAGLDPDTVPTRRRHNRVPARYSTLFSATELLEAEARLLDRSCTRTAPTLPLVVIERVTSAPLCRTRLVCVRSRLSGASRKYL